MDENTRSLSRRRVLQGSAAVAVAVPLGAALTGCAGGGGDDSGKAPTVKKTKDNPFGLAKDTKIEAVIFNGGYKTDYVSFAAKKVDEKFSTKTKVTPSTKIAQQLQPRFVGGNPPDLVDNSGANQIGFSSILKGIEELDDIFEANNYEGTKIADTLYPHVKDTGTYSGKFVALNYVMTVYGMWYSASLFDENGWKPPKTWDEAIDLGAKAKGKGKYLFVFGKEAATYYQTLAVDSAIKEGGPEVRLALENLKPKCWSHPAIQKVFKALETCVKKGYFVPGGAGTQFTKAQARWSNDEKAILYPSGGWIENEMKKATKDGFKMTGFPEMTVTDSPAMPWESIRAASGEPFIVPSKGNNPGGGKEVLRAMLSKDAATNFTKTRLAPTIVKGLVPDDGFGSTALQSQSKMLDDAGTHVFNYQFVDYYGMNKDQLVQWNSFLSGKMDAAKLTKALQSITDKIANDDSIKKNKVTK